MTNEIFTVLGQAGVIALLGVAGAFLLRRDFKAGWFIAALLLYVVYDFLLTRAFFTFPDPLEGVDWNWSGKLASLAGMLIVAATPLFGFRRAGVTLRQGTGFGFAFVVFILFVALFFYMAISGADGRDDWETIAFQWTMPGLDEEVFYRGVLLLAMNEAFRGRLNVIGAPIGYGGLLTSVLFGLAHGLSYGEAGYSFDGMTFLMTGGPSLILLWLRERTGSILLPVIAHNVANGAFTVF